MVVFGPGFEQDPGCPWAAGILADETFPSPTHKADELHREGVAVLRARAEHED